MEKNKYLSVSIPPSIIRDYWAGEVPTDLKFPVKIKFPY
jgi:hypothetical protein